MPPPPTEAPTTTVVAAPPDTGVPFLSGVGRRVVYSKNQMRVWIVDDTNVTIRTYRVVGTHGSTRSRHVSRVSRVRRSPATSTTRTSA